MGAVQTPGTDANKRLAVVPVMKGHVWARWLEKKEKQSSFLGKDILGRPGSADIVRGLYERLGGEDSVHIKGGVAVEMYVAAKMEELAIRPPWSQQAPFGGVHDVDFVCTANVSQIVQKAVHTLHYLSYKAHKCGTLERFLQRWPTSELRRDAETGISFLDERRSLGTPRVDETVFKITVHRGRNRKSKENYDLVRIGLGVWDPTVFRTSVPAVVDVAVTTASQRPSRLLVNGMQTESPRSMLRTLRRMIFHEADYRPWLADDPEKMFRRLERLMKLSIVEDLRMEGRGEQSLQDLLERWRSDFQNSVFWAAAEDTRACVKRSAEKNPAERQRRYFLKVCARTFEEAANNGLMEDCGYWLDDVIVRVERVTGGELHWPFNHHLL